MRYRNHFLCSSAMGHCAASPPSAPMSCCADPDPIPKSPSGCRRAMFFSCHRTAKGFPLSSRRLWLAGYLSSRLPSEESPRRSLTAKPAFLFDRATGTPLGLSCSCSQETKTADDSWAFWRASAPPSFSTRTDTLHKPGLCTRAWCDIVHPLRRGEAAAPEAEKALTSRLRLLR